MIGFFILQNVILVKSIATLDEWLVYSSADVKEECGS